MKHNRVTLFVLLAAVLFSTGTAAVQQPGAESIRGAWRTSTPHPALLIFTDRHYSLMVVNAERPLYESGKAAPDQKITTFDAFSANSGTYEVKGSKLMLSRVVAKNRSLEGTRQEVDFRIEGKTLTVMYSPPLVLTRAE